MTMELREEARRREEERADLAQRRELFARDLRTLAALPEGRRVFRWLMDQGNIFAEDYQPGPLGAYRSGMRTMSLRIWGTLRDSLPIADFVAIALDGHRGAAAEASGGGLGSDGC